MFRPFLRQRTAIPSKAARNREGGGALFALQQLALAGLCISVATPKFVMTPECFSTEFGIERHSPNI